MRDKLFKTNRKAGFYRMRRGLLLGFFLILGAAAITFPYRYVVQAINAYQEQRESETEVVSSEELVVADELI